MVASLSAPREAAVSAGVGLPLPRFEPDKIDRGSEDSFPASDAPSWTAIVRTGNAIGHDALDRGAL